MKQCLKYALSAISTLFIYGHMLAQSMFSGAQSIRQDIDNMFSEIDRGKVATGFLLDYAIDLVDLAQYDGTILTDSNYVHRSIYEDILHSLHSACVQTTNPIGDVSSIMGSLNSSLSARIAKISVINHTYNQIKANALTDQLIIFENDIP